MDEIGDHYKPFESREMQEDSSSRSRNIKTSRISKAQEKIREGMIEKNHELLRIYFCERNKEGNIEYIIEEREKQLRKCGTKELMKLYADQLVAFLEKSVLSKEERYPLH